MRKKEFRVTDPTEGAFLAQVAVRLVMPTELARCEQEVCENHYLGNAHLVGEQLWYVAEYQGQWLALLGWSAAAYHWKGREGWIGWNDTQRLLGGDEAKSLWQVLHEQVPESRKVHGLRHKQATVLAIVFAYLLSGGRGGHRGVALFAQDLSPTQRAAFRCWFNRKTSRYEVPAENCIYRVLKEVLVVKGNQKTLLGQAQNFLPENFSPSSDDPRRGPRTHRVARDKSEGNHARTNGLSSCPSARARGPHS